MEQEEVKNKGSNKGYDNLIPCKPGETANPNGRPVGQRNYATIYKEALQILADKNATTPEKLEAEMIANAAVLARKGDFRFYKDILDRIHGSPVSRTEITGANGKDLFLAEEDKSIIDKALNNI